MSRIGSPSQLRRCPIGSSARIWQTVRAVKNGEGNGTKSLPLGRVKKKSLFRKKKIDLMQILERIVLVVSTSYAKKEQHLRRTEE